MSPVRSSRPPKVVFRFGRGSPILANAALVLASAALVFAAAPGAGQVRDDKARAAPSDVTVTLKLVQVYVTGKDGKPVSDLSASDFTVTDNGKPVAITHFEKHVLAEDAAILKAEIPPGAAPGTITAAIMPLARKFFLFFDYAFIEPRSAVRARAAALDFLDRCVKPGDEVGVLSYSARGFKMHEYLTTDLVRVRSAVESLGLKGAAGMAETVQSAYDPEADDDQARRMAGTRYADHVRKLLGAMTETARALRSIPGYKNVVLFSRGIAQRLLYGTSDPADAPAWSNPEDAAGAMAAYDASRADTGIASDFSEMTRAFKEAGAPVYAVDVMDPMPEADIGSAISASPAAREYAGGKSLRDLAGQTGGKFYSAYQDPRAVVSDIESVTGAFYVLGFSIPARWDGKFHKLKVKVSRAGCEVAAQNGYFNPVPFKDLDPFRKMLHMVDLALGEHPSSEVPVEAPLRAFPLMAGGWTQIVAYLALAGDGAGEILGERSEACLVLVDQAGRATAKTFAAARTREAVMNRDLTAVAAFLLPVRPGKYVCRMAVRNGETGQGMRGAAVVEVPETAASPGIHLEAMVLLQPGRSSDVVPSPELRLSRLFGYDPETYAPTAGIYPAGADRIFAAFRLSGPADGVAGDVELVGSLKPDGSGERRGIPVSILARASAGTDRTCLAELRTGPLAAGRYRIDIVAKPSGAVAASAVSADLVVHD